MAKSPHTPEWKALVAQEYMNGTASSNDIGIKYGVDPKTDRCWAQRYKEQGISAFIRGAGNTKYTSDFKTKCVEVYISGEMSVDEIVAKYNISARYVLYSWIKRYYANRELTDYNPKREVYMAGARRKTTIAERKEIVDYCIKHNHNYKETASL